MKKMSDPELRVVMIVTRATFGWILDDKSGMRKEEDWISHSQMVERSGKSSRAISNAITSCIKNSWIEARDENGNILHEALQRRKHGKKIYYRLGNKFLGRAETIASGAKVEPSHVVPLTIANNDTKPSHVVLSTKETLTKETLTKRPEKEESDKRPTYSEIRGYDTKAVARLINLAEEFQDFRFPNKRAQESAISKMLQSGFSEEKIWEKRQELVEDEFWGLRGVDYLIVLNQIGKAKRFTKSTGIKSYGTKK